MNDERDDGTLSEQPALATARELLPTLNVKIRKGKRQNNNVLARFMIDRDLHARVTKLVARYPRITGAEVARNGLAIGLALYEEFGRLPEVVTTSPEAARAVAAALNAHMAVPITIARSGKARIGTKLVDRSKVQLAQENLELKRKLRQLRGQYAVSKWKARKRRAASAARMRKQAASLARKYAAQRLRMLETLVLKKVRKMTRKQTDAAERAIAWEIRRVAGLLDKHSRMIADKPVKVRPVTRGAGAKSTKQHG